MNGTLTPEEERVTAQEWLAANQRALMAEVAAVRDTLLGGDQAEPAERRPVQARTRGVPSMRYAPASD